MEKDDPSRVTVHVVHSASVSCKHLHARGSASLCEGGAVNRKRTDPAVREGEGGCTDQLGFTAAPHPHPPGAANYTELLFLFISLFLAHTVQYVYVCLKHDRV